MKYLCDFPELDALSDALSLTNSSVRVSARVEAYSCKPVSKERKLFKKLDEGLASDISFSTSLSPPEDRDGVVSSVFGPLDRKESRKTFWLLVATLNVAFPDHDFTRVRPDEFSREPGPIGVLSHLSDVLSHSGGGRSFSAYPADPSSTTRSSSAGHPILDRLLAGGTGSGFFSNPDAASVNPHLRDIVDPIIGLDECEVYSYVPEPDSDPHAEETDDDDSDDSSFFEGDDLGDDEDLFGLAALGSYMDGFESPARGRATGFNPRSVSSRAGSVISAGDDHGVGGLLFSCNWFLYNKRAKRIVFISVWGKVNDPAAPRALRRPRRRPPVRTSEQSDLAAAKALELFYASEDPAGSMSGEESSPPKLMDLDLAASPPTFAFQTLALPPDLSLQGACGEGDAEAGVGAAGRRPVPVPVPTAPPRPRPDGPKRAASSSSLTSLGAATRAKKRTKASTA